MTVTAAIVKVVCRRAPTTTITRLLSFSLKYARERHYTLRVITHTGIIRPAKRSPVVCVVMVYGSESRAG